MNDWLTRTILILVGYVSMYLAHEAVVWAGGPHNFLTESLVALGFTALIIIAGHRLFARRK